MLHIFKKLPLLTSHFSSSHLSPPYTRVFFLPLLTNSFSLQKKPLLALLVCLFLTIQFPAQILSSYDLVPFSQFSTNHGKLSICSAATWTLTLLLFAVNSRRGGKDSLYQNYELCFRNLPTFYLTRWQKYIPAPQSWR